MQHSIPAPTNDAPQTGTASRTNAEHQAEWRRRRNSELNFLIETNKRLEEMIRDLNDAIHASNRILRIDTHFVASIDSEATLRNLTEAIEQQEDPFGDSDSQYGDDL